VSEHEQSEFWRTVLLGETRGLDLTKKIVGRIPSGPRCKLCTAPLNAPGSILLKPFGFGPSKLNRRLCRACFRQVEKVPGGAEIELSLLFADIRGSTGLAEQVPAQEFSRLISRFYGAAASVVDEWNGLVDKFVGDEVVALFFGGVSGPGHAAAGIAAAERLVERCGRADATPMGPIPVGAGVHTGQAYVGTSGPVGQAVDDFTALGDPVNAAARLASSAGAGEILVSVDALTAAGREATSGDRRTVEIRGRQGSLDVVVLRPRAPVPA
jgi:adenylate cyclase